MGVVGSCWGRPATKGNRKGTRKGRAEDWAEGPAAVGHRDLEGGQVSSPGWFPPAALGSLCSGWEMPPEVHAEMGLCWPVPDPGLGVRVRLGFRLINPNRKKQGRDELKLEIFVPNWNSYLLNLQIFLKF